MNLRFIVFLVLLVAISFVHAQEIDQCTRYRVVSAAIVFDQQATYSPSGKLIVESLPNCTSYADIEWSQDVELIYGPIQEGEVVISERSVYVDSTVRPDLDVPALITFNNVNFAITPQLLKDGSSCDVGCSNETFNFQTQTYSVYVDGFSNYTLTGQQDFTVLSDNRPEVGDKIYQVVDLGNAYRGESFACIVMLFARSPEGNFVLVQTNPERQVQSRLFGSPDTNQPESLGYFPTTNGVANVYFRNYKLEPYNDFQYVVTCQNNNTQLVFEESIVPTLSPLGRNTVPRTLWLIREDGGRNISLVIIYFVIGVIGIILLFKFIDVLRR